MDYQQSNTKDFDPELENDEIQCQQCATVPDNYVKLDCDHKFCLICLAYNYLQLQQQMGDDPEVENLAICTVCKQHTPLDQETVQALRFVIQEIIVPMMEQNQKDGDISADRETIKITEVQEDDKEEQEEQESEIQSLLQNNRNERIHTYLDRLDKNFQQKFQMIKDIQESKFQFQSKCQQAKEEINNQFQQFILSVESKRNSLLSEINTVEMVQLLEIQKQENLYEKQIEKMAKHQEELQSFKKLNKHPEELNTLLMEVEKVIGTSGSTFSMSQLQTAQRSLQRIQSQANSYLVQPKENNTGRDSILLNPSIKLNTQQSQENTKETLDRLPIPQLPSQTQHRLSPKQERIADIWQKFNESGSKRKQLQDSQVSLKGSNQKSKWKEALLDIFEKKPEQEIVYDRAQQQQQSIKQTMMHKMFNIHQVLDMQQQNFMVQRETLLRR